MSVSQFLLGNFFALMTSFFWRCENIPDPLPFSDNSYVSVFTYLHSFIHTEMETNF